MDLLKMRPAQIREAVAENRPVLMAAGVLEYHGPHLPVGTDVLIPGSIVDEVARRCPCIVAPPLPFGPTMSWAGGPEDGEVDFAPEPLFQYAKSVFAGLLSIGFRRIYVLHHHQGDGLQRQCLKRAATETIRDVVRLWGNGWGRAPQHAWPDPNVFGWIHVAGLAEYSDWTDETKGYLVLTHAGKGETQMVLAAYPETIDLDALGRMERVSMPEWPQDAELADAVEGRSWLEFCVEGWVRRLQAGP